MFLIAGRLLKGAASCGFSLGFVVDPFPGSPVRPVVAAPLEVMEDRSMPATFTVNTTLDVLRSGRSDTTSSLRQAIIDANASKTADTIVLPVGTYTLTRAGVGEDNCLTGDLDIKGPLTINGAGSASTIVDGAGLDRVVHLHSYAATFSGLAARGGNASTDMGGGGIYSPSLGGALTVSNCVVSGNSTSGYGGGIYGAGSLTVTDSTLSGNRSSWWGGDLYNGATMTVRGSTFSDNTVVGDAYGAGGLGGGIYSTGQVMTVESCTLSGNHANSGGGLYYSGYNTYTETVRYCTIADNTAAFRGGGIRKTGGILTVQSCTLTGNSAIQGGAVSALGILTIDTCTLSGNTASQVGGIYSGKVTVLNSMVVGNSATDSGIYNPSGARLTLRGSTLLDNSSPLGADLYNLGILSIEAGSTIGVMFP
jgi:predicted outer membrane repeat protein